MMMHTTATTSSNPQSGNPSTNACNNQQTGHPSTAVGNNQDPSAVTDQNQQVSLVERRKRSVSGMVHPSEALKGISGEQIPFADMGNILSDFRDDEALATEAPLLITEMISHIYCRLASADSRRFTCVLHGTSGVGKTTTLRAIGHLARKSGCLVFPIAGRTFVENGKPIGNIVWEFLRTWKDVNQIILGQIPSRTTRGSILSVVEQGLENQNIIVDTFILLFSEFKLQSDVRVVALFDDCNAISDALTALDACNTPEARARRAIYHLLSDFNVGCHVKHGCCLFAFSSSFPVLTLVKDGNDCLLREVLPMKEEIFKKYITILVEANILPKVCTDNINDLYETCGGLPREAAKFGSKEVRDWDQDYQSLKSRYLELQAKKFETRIRELMEEKQGLEKRTSLKFLCRLFMKEEMFHIPSPWISTGFFVTQGATYKFACPAVELGLIKMFDESTTRAAIEAIANDPIMSFRAMELAFTFIFRNSIICGASVDLHCTDLKGNAKSRFSVKVLDIVHSLDEPAANSIAPGTLLVCTAGQAVVDCVIYSQDRSVFAVQLYKLPFSKNGSRWNLRSKEILDRFVAAMNISAVSVRYLYITLSNLAMSKRTKLSEDQKEVLLLSNIKGAANRFFRGLFSGK